MKKLVVLGMFMMVLLVPVVSHAVTFEAGLIVAPQIGKDSVLIDPRAAAFGLSVKATQPVSQKTKLFFNAGILQGESGQSEATGEFGIKTEKLEGLPEGAVLSFSSTFTSRIDGEVGGDGDSLSSAVFKITMPIKK